MEELNRKARESSASFDGKKHLRICYVVRGFWPDSIGGGIVSYAESVSKGIVERGHHVVILTLSPSGASGRYEYEGIPVYVVPEISVNRINLLFSNLLNSIRLKNTLQQLLISEDLNLVESPEIGAYSLFFTSLAVRNVVRLHTSTKQLYLWQNKPIRDHRVQVICWLERLSIMKADAVSATTRFSVEDTQRSLHLCKKSITVLPNLVAPLDLPDQPTLNTGTQRVIYIGRLEKRKGVHILAQSIPFVLSKYPEVKFEFIGPDTREGPNRSSMKAYCLSLIPRRYHSFVDFLGYIPHLEVMQRLGRSQILAFPTFFEAFPMTLIESMMLGVPVIASHVAGIPEIVVHQETGLLVPPGAPITLAEAITRLLLDDAYRRQLGVRAREVMMERYSTAQGIRLFEEFYRAVLSREN